MKNQTNFETLNKKVNVKKIILGVGALAIIGVAIVGRITHASYSSRVSVPLVNGKITYKHPDFRIMAIHVKDSNGNYVEQDRMPNSDYMINESKTYCTKGSSSEKDTEARIYTDDLGQHVISNLLKNDRCYLYFDRANNVSSILAKYAKNTSRTGQVTAPFTENTPTTVYSKADDNGTSYVFAGVNPNNWVKLGNLYFRIIRFNGDGTMRLIYSGEGSAQTSGTGTQIGTKAFNSSSDDNMYVGLQYTSGEVHGNGTNSTILGEENSSDVATLFGWYNSKIKPSYSSLIDTNAGFCSDRDPYTDSNGTTSGGGTWWSETYYGAYIRYVIGGSYQTTYIPTLKCKNASDNLKLPVGLITVDEYALAGGGAVNRTNTTFWLHTGQHYWTMTPSDLDIGADASVFYINLSGYLYNSKFVVSTLGVRPVINLKASTTFQAGGTGTAEKPWTVKI